MNEILKTYIVDIRIEMTSTFCIGSGTNEQYDIEVVKLPNGRPYIPFTSWMGALKHYFFENCVFTAPLNDEAKRTLHYFWGDASRYMSGIDIASEQLPQSHLVPEADFDIYLQGGELNYRDGIKLKQNKTVENKYDFETVDAGAVINFRLRLDVKDGIDENVLLNCLKSVRESIPNVTIGAKSNAGLGKQKLQHFHCYLFDFAKPNHQTAWFKYRYDEMLDDKLKFGELEQIESYISPPNAFTISTEIEIGDTLLNGGGVDLNEVTDKKPYKNKKGQFLLRGETWKGGIRSKMTQIAYAINSNDFKKTNSLIDNLFGFISENDNTKQKGRIRFDETIIKEAKSLIHHRVAIDHFTGGALSGAKYDAEVIQHDKEKIKLQCTITDIEPHEHMWLIRAIIDLLLADFPIGADAGIGRGRFYGKKLDISYDNTNLSLMIGEHNLGLSNEGIKTVTTWQNEFVNEIKSSEDVKK